DVRSSRLRKTATISKTSECARDLRRSGVRLAYSRSTIRIQWRHTPTITVGRDVMKRAHRCSTALRKIALGVAAGLLALPGGSLADEPVKEAAKTIDERVSDLEKVIAAFNDISLGGMLYGSYRYNFNRPADRQNSLR